MKEGSIDFFTKSLVLDDSFHIKSLNSEQNVGNTLLEPEAHLFSDILDKKDCVQHMDQQRVKRTSTAQKEFNDILRHIDRKNIQFEDSEFDGTMRKCESPEASVELSSIFRGKPHIS